MVVRTARRSFSSSFCAKLNRVLSPPTKSTPNNFSPRVMPKPRDTMTNSHVTMNSGLAMPKKLTLALLMRCSIGSDLMRFRSSRKLKIKRVTTSAVNKLAATPMVSVTPKPLISPAPPMDDNSMGDMAMGVAPSGAEQRAAALASAPGNEGMKEGLEALNLLAHSPQTAHFISWKIAQRFVADDPPPALVDRMARTFLASGGDIKSVLRTLVASPEFNSKKYFRNKVKTPMEFLASAYRTTLTDPSNPGALVNTIKNMGMPLYYALPPTGSSITADHWMNSGALVDRLNFADQLTSGKFANQKFDAPRIVALGLMSEPAQLPQAGGIVPARPAHAAYAEATLTEPASSAEPATPAGTEIPL